MTPTSHILFFAAGLFGLGLVGMLVRRSATISLVSGSIMLQAAVLALCSVRDASAEASLQSVGMVLLALMAGIGLVGAALVYNYTRFRRSVSVDEQDSLKH